MLRILLVVGVVAVFCSNEGAAQVEIGGVMRAGYVPGQSRAGQYGRQREREREYEHRMRLERERERERHREHERDRERERERERDRDRDRDLDRRVDRLEDRERARDDYHRDREEYRRSRREDSDGGAVVEHLVHEELVLEDQPRRSETPRTFSGSGGL